MFFFYYKYECFIRKNYLFNKLNVKNILAKKGILDRKVLRRKKVRRRIRYFLFIKLTLNNLFPYVYNFYNFRRLQNKKVVRYKLNFTSMNLGMTGYKGPAKNSNIALETAGVLLAAKLKEKCIKKVNLVLFTRLNRKIKEFLKGLCKIGRLKIKYIYFFPKFAHNGCRLKSKKRL